ncbi:hypothetical protein FOXB_17094, partial [Fusarium oxysporum f. sp. conglutinans Fo5176]
MGANSARLTNDDLRRQMLNTIFGWNKDVEDLIRDEMSRHRQGSPSRILLAKWLGDIDPNIMNANFENITSSDWMLLALSGIGGHTSQQKLGHAYVQRLLEAGDVHTAVTIMLGMGDHNDAIEVYISHKRYMEALILTCLSAPSVWERQAAIIRKWGEWAVQRGEQQLAIRCFACTDQESTEPWISPSAAQLNFQTMTPSIPEVLSPPLSPLGVQRDPQRSIAKPSALKLITSFGDQTQKSKFFAGDGGQTPIASGVTPIADSAGSPAFSHASNNEATTAFLHPSNNSRFNTPVSARARGRLPSIGEIPSDLNREALRSAELSAVPYHYEPRCNHVRTPSGNDNMMRSEDEEDYRTAMATQEGFRNKHSRSGSRGLGSPALNKQGASEHWRRANFEAANFDGSISVHGRAASTEHAGDLKQMKDERQRKKEHAARELEERRKSLAQRAQTPSIPHPNEFSPALAITVETAEPKPLPGGIPPRSATEPPQRSMYARNRQVIGLPATPKAMRLIIEGTHDQSGSTPRPDVPSIPAGFSQRYSPDSSPQQLPEREEPVAEPSLTLLPSTVYQPPARPPIPRSMSATIPDEPGQRPAHFARKNSVGRIEEVVPGEQRRSHEDPMPPPPPPPAPPVLKELRHLASPPPPPVPLQHAQRYQKTGAVASGMIEIVMDDDLSSGNDQA